MSLADLSFFTRADEADPDGPLVPTELAKSSWSGGQLHGVALCGALGRAAERAVAALGRDDLRPSRLSVDLFRPAAMEPCAFDARIVREGKRICLVDVVMTQDGERVARAGVLFLKPTADADGRTWTPPADTRPSVPPTDVVPPSDEPRAPFLLSGDGAEGGGWSQRFGDHQDDSRKTSWNSAVRVVLGEPLTPFQAAAATADGASLVVNWGTRGVQHINTDVTLALSRQPVGTEIGLHALDRTETDGIAVGTATMFDRQGPIGTVVLTALVNARRTIDFTGIAYDDDGTRHSD